MDSLIFSYYLPPETEPHFHTKVTSQETIFVGRSYAARDREKYILLYIFLYIKWLLY